MRKTAPTRTLVSYLLIFQHPKAIFKSLSGMTLFLVMGAGNELKSHGLILMTTSIACQCDREYGTSLCIPLLGLGTLVPPHIRQTSSTYVQESFHASFLSRKWG